MLSAYFSAACVVWNTVYNARPHDLCECIWLQRVAQGYTNPGNQSTQTTKLPTVILHVVCLTTSPQPLPKRVLHTVRSSASSLSFQYPLFSLTPSSSCPFLLPRLHVTSILSCVCPPTTCYRRHFPRKMWPIPLAFLRPWLYVTLLHFSHHQSSWFFSTLLQNHIPKLSGYFWYTFRNVRVSAPYKAVPQM